MSDTDGAGRGADLFEQWLAHHEGRPEDAAPHPEPPAVVEAGDDSSIEPQLPDHNVAAAGVLAALRPEEPGPEPVHLVGLTVHPFAPPRKATVLPPTGGRRWGDTLPGAVPCHASPIGGCGAA